MTGDISWERTWHSTLCDLTKVKKQRVKEREKRVQEGEERRRKRNRIEDGTLMRRSGGSEEEGKTKTAVGQTNVLRAGPRINSIMN